MATITNLYVDQGSTFNSIVTLRNQNGTPMNLTGYTVKSQFRKSYQSSQAFNFTTSVFDATTGRIRLQLPADYSSTIRAGRYLYDIEITSPIGEKLRALEGIVVISPEITQV
jgi:hypothetical protein